MEKSRRCRFRTSPPVKFFRALEKGALDATEIFNAPSGQEPRFL